MPPSASRASIPVLFSVIVIDLIGFGVVLPVLPFYAKEFGASATVLGGILTGYAAMQFVFSPIWGRLSDRIGRRPVMLVTMAGTSIALVGLGFAPSLAWILVARVVAGCFGANITVATAYITDITNEEERTRWMGMVGASFGIGFLVGPAIGGLLSVYGAAVPMLFAGGLAAVNFVYAAFVLREPEVHRDADAASLGRLRVLENPLVRRLALLNLLFALAVTQLEATFAYLMADRFAYDARDVAFILVLMAFVMAGIQGGAIRHLASRFGERRLLIAGTAMMAACFPIVPLAPTVTILLAPLVVLAVGRAVSQPSMMSMVSIAASASSRGEVMGTYHSSNHLARIVGPLVAGALYDGALSGPYLLGGGLLLLAALLSAPLPGRAQEAAPVADPDAAAHPPA